MLPHLRPGVRGIALRGSLVAWPGGSGAEETCNGVSDGWEVNLDAQIDPATGPNAEAELSTEDKLAIFEGELTPDGATHASRGFNPTLSGKQALAIYFHARGATRACRDTGLSLRLATDRDIIKPDSRFSGDTSLRSCMGIGVAFTRSRDITAQLAGGFGMGIGTNLGFRRT